MYLSHRPTTPIRSAVQFSPFLFSCVRSRLRTLIFLFHSRLASLLENTRRYELLCHNVYSLSCLCADHSPLLSSLSPPRSLELTGALLSRATLDMPPRPLLVLVHVQDYAVSAPLHVTIPSRRQCGLESVVQFKRGVIHYQAEQPTPAVRQPLLQHYVSHSFELDRASQPRYSADVVVTYPGTI